MLPKKQRLTSAEVTSVASAGKVIRTESFFVKYLPFSRFACSVVVSKKTVRLAVNRNKLRRQVYAVITDTTRKDRFRLAGYVLTLKKVPLPEKTLLRKEIEKIFSY
jgi:ribonuclease P protein component